MNEDLSYIGISNVDWVEDLKASTVEEDIGILQHDRNSHFYIIGQSGTGKTTLLRNLIIQDIQAGRGAILIDPHGDLAQELPNYVPKSRTRDVVYIDPSDYEHPIGINFFSQVPDDDVSRALVIEQIVSVFKHVWDLDDVQTPRLLYVLRNAISALIEAPQTSLLGIYQMLVDRTYRDRILAYVSDHQVRQFWDEFDQMTNRERRDITSSTINKAGQLNASPVLRTIVGQTKPKLDFRYLMDQGRVVICDLSKGKIGESGSSLVGSMILIQIYIAALARADTDEGNRTPCHLYIDEFQNFGSSSVFEDMLSESRKYGLKMTLAHQFMSQIDRPLQDAVLGNVGSIASFRIGSRDAEVLAKEFSREDHKLEPHEFTELEAHYVRLRLQEEGSRAHILAKTLEPIGGFTGQRESIVNFTRQHFSQPRARVQKGINREFGFT